MRLIALSERLILNYIIVSAIAIASLGGLSYYLARKALLERTFSQLTSVRTVKKSQVENFFTDREREVVWVAKSQDVSTALDLLSKAEIGIEAKEIRNFSMTNYFYHFLTSTNYYKKFLIADTSGKSFLIEAQSQDSLPRINLMGTGDPLSPESKLRLLKQEVFVQDYRSDLSTEEPLLWVSTAIRDDWGKVKGYFSCGIASHTLDVFMLESDASGGLGKTGESYLVGQDSLLRTHSRFANYFILKTKVTSAGATKAFAKGSGTGIYDDYRGINVIGSYDQLKISGLNWVILVELDFPEAMVPIFNLRNNLMLLSAVIAMMVFILTFLIARRITLPLVRLKNAAQEISEGKLSSVELPATHDEIKELAETFNKMVRELDSKSRELSMERAERLSAVLDGQEQERQRLSRELHDGLGQLLAATKLRLESIRPEDPLQSTRTIKEVSKGVDHTIDEIRRITNDLMPAVLKEFGLVTAIRNLCETTAENAGLLLEFDSTTDAKGLDIKAQTYLFRIFQEALTNTVKHAFATKISVGISTSGKRVFVDLEDNGKGFHISQLGKGNGLSNIRERVHLLQGKLEISAFPGKGAHLHIEIPMND